MNRKLLIFFGLLALFTQACKLDPPIFGPPPKEDWSASFQPLGTGSYWQYVKQVEGSLTDTAVLLVTGEQPVINGLTYHTVYSESKRNRGDDYFYADNHVIIVREFFAKYNDNVEIQYLVDTLTAGQSWTAKITDSGLLEGVPARLVGKVLEDSITKVVSGITFPRVRHTQMQLQQDKGSGFQTFATYDYYIQMGVGVIENIGVQADGTDLGHIRILSYDIKSNEIKTTN
ncbi:hypothetical protein IDJ77_17995 [Mucilaginibacter sp. ZT4R22]|uniref:Uncharacterized protein n=1 Tax=Mucilaginibacter pankratovii TaxID=2772110 RepID=A0ABR7WTS7_9SPHI|nr:hypothetical protein [Mucilaginibacter pankratovii]MBD1365713.1 hypothetical protein [Mucilaginibacter pankratovii]